jgi:hypothetical protein
MICPNSQGHFDRQCANIGENCAFNEFDCALNEPAHHLVVVPLWPRRAPQPAARVSGSREPCAQNRRRSLPAPAGWYRSRDDTQREDQSAGGSSFAEYGARTVVRYSHRKVCVVAAEANGSSTLVSFLGEQGGNTAPLLRAGCPQSFREDRPKDARQDSFNCDGRGMACR